MVPNQENMEGDQPVQSSHAQQPLQPQKSCMQERCPGEIRPTLSVFQARYPNCLYSTTCQSLELLIQCRFIWKETMQLVSGKIEFNACQVALLWHNSFLVSLWTFQPTRTWGVGAEVYIRSRIPAKEFDAICRWTSQLTNTSRANSIWLSLSTGGLWLQVNVYT